MSATQIPHSHVIDLARRCRSLRRALCAWPDNAYAWFRHGRWASIGPSVASIRAPISLPTVLFSSGLL